MLSFIRRLFNPPNSAPPSTSRLDEINTRLALLNKMRIRLGNLIRNQQVMDAALHKTALQQLNVERILLITEAEVSYGVTPKD
jgi:hypothetical protein